MRELKQSTAANVIIFMADSTDHITGKTGLTLTVTLSKDGGAFASITPTVTERTNGWYNIALTSSHTDTLGDCVVRATSTGADASERALNVVANIEADTYARVGAPAGASVSADMAAVKTDTAFILSDTGTDGVVVAAASKTGYSLTQSFPANFASLSITVGGLVDITQAAADKVWGTITRILTAGTNIALAKGIGVTGFNDISVANIEATTVLAKEATLTAIKAKTDALPEGIKKNTLFNNFEFLMVDSTDNKTGKTGLTITATRSIDGGVFAACANAATEVASGIYKINLAASDLNGDMITFKFSAATANDRLVTIKTSP